MDILGGGATYDIGEHNPTPTKTRQSFRVLVVPSRLASEDKGVESLSFFTAIAWSRTQVFVFDIFEEILVF